MKMIKIIMSYRALQSAVKFEQLILLYFIKFKVCYSL